MKLLSVLFPLFALAGFAMADGQIEFCDSTNCGQGSCSVQTDTTNNGGGQCIQLGGILSGLPLAVDPGCACKLTNLLAPDFPMSLLSAFSFV
jgi:hypothetical protein